MLNIHRPTPSPQQDLNAPLFESIPDDALGPLEHLVQSAVSKSLFSCLQRLAARERQTIALAFLHGLTHAELADHLKEPLGTVKTYVRRGLAQLKDCLQA